MSATTFISWTDLFSSKTPADFTLELRAIKKSGCPFLFVPLASSLAAHSLSLYPAQTGFAKFARSILRTAFQTRLPVPLEKTSVSISSSDPFPRFLANLLDVPLLPLPALAILAGNPRVEGRRFIILLFDERRQPAFVVKAGIGDSARQLIRHEASFLHSAPPGTPGLPLLRGAFDAGLISAFALDFVEGNSPESEASSSLGRLLPSWINHKKQIQLREIPAWQALEKAMPADPLFKLLSQKLADLALRPTIFHGDLAPWNIKVSSTDKSWKVLDWERGDLIGIPGWDWFHYFIQSRILIHKQTADQLAGEIEALLASPDFQNYADIARIRGSERPLVVAYLLHLINLVCPSEGIETNKSLLSLLSGRWLN